MRRVRFHESALIAVALFAAPAAAQSELDKLEQASQSVQLQLAEAVEELTALRERIKDEKIPLSKRLSDLERQLSELRQESRARATILDGRTLDVANLDKEIKARKDEVSYLSTLLTDYLRSFETKLLIPEVQRYEADIEAARLAPENETLSGQEIFLAQAAVLDISLGRLEEALSGTTFAGTAIGTSGLVSRGEFMLVGPTALFRSQDGTQIGTAEQKVGSYEPTLVPFDDPLDATAASSAFAADAATYPLDPSLGNAQKIAATKETFVEHVKKGGAVMVPIFALAGAALLVALYKWVALMFVRKPGRKALAALFEAVRGHDADGAQRAVAAIKGPTGRMLAAGVEHLEEPRELIEEVMYERVLTTRLKVMRFLPFISICAASAPLLGLLGTVTGIIDTFKMITVFGSGDVRTLSGGISKALITTEFGLIVAIPALLLHAFLSRMARGRVTAMETSAVAFLNHVARSPFGPKPEPVLATNDVLIPRASDPQVVRTQVKQALGDIISSIVTKDEDRRDELTASRV